MPSPAHDSLVPDRPRAGLGRVVAESAGVLAVGLAVAVAANALSPRGLSWTRDYFPTTAVPAHVPAPPRAPGAQEARPAAVPTPPAGVGRESTSTGTAPEAAVDPIVERLRQRGLAPVSFEEVVRLFEDPRREEERILFVDARKDERYQDGHIPGAYQLDHYYPDRYLPELLPACQTAEVVVVYCTGGACEDSEYAALLLKEAGIPVEHLRVYLGGIEEWKARGRAVEAGVRRSGDLRSTPAPGSPP